MFYFFYQNQRNAAFKFGFFIVCVKYKGGENQLDNRIRKIGNGLREGFCSEFKVWLSELFRVEQQLGREYGDDGYIYYRYYGIRYGFEDQFNDYVSKNGKVELGMVFQFCGNRKQSNNGDDRQRRKISLLFSGRFYRVMFAKKERGEFFREGYLM